MSDLDLRHEALLQLAEDVKALDELSGAAIELAHHLAMEDPDDPMLRSCIDRLAEVAAGLQTCAVDQLGGSEEPWPPVDWLALPERTTRAMR